MGFGSSALSGFSDAPHDDWINVIQRLAQFAEVLMGMFSPEVAGIDRRGFLFRTICLYGLLMFATMASAVAPLAGIPIALFSLGWFIFRVVPRRLRSAGLSQRFNILIFVPVLNLVLFAVLLFKPPVNALRFGSV